MTPTMETRTTGFEIRSLSVFLINFLAMKKAVSSRAIIVQRKYNFLLLLCIFVSFFSVQGQNIQPGAYQTDQYVSALKSKKVGVVAHHASMIENSHLVDSLQTLGIEIVKVFAPEHGFRGTADAGEKVKDGIDPQSQLPIVSLYGSNKKPSKDKLRDIDIMVFDLQDVGVRFYTYISTLHYVMEACAENDIPLIILDRPNPNGHYVDGPVLDPKFKSFIGMHPVPVVYGMSIGEYGQMINGEGWLDNGVQCELQVIKCKNYDHNSFYELPVKPSPNLPNMASVYLYPSLCFFEGTSVSVGRGTPFPFQVFGHPEFADTLFSFTPQPMEGAKNPKHKGERCYGYHLEEFGKSSLKKWGRIYIYWLTDAYSKLGGDLFSRPDFFDLLAGSNTFRRQIMTNTEPYAIYDSWKEDLEKFKKVRVKYLIYEDFD